MAFDNGYYLVNIIQKCITVTVVASSLQFPMAIERNYDGAVKFFG
jgi:hypothetical protein